MTTKTVKMADIARMAGVTKPVVSAVLNDSKTIRVSDKKRKEIERLIRKHNFLPNATARNLAKKETMAIALVIPSMRFFEYLPYAQITASLQETLSSRNYRLQIITLASYFEDYKLINRIEADGLIVMYWGPNQMLVINELRKFSLPVLTIFSKCREEDIPNLYIDNRAARYEQAKSVIAAGHKNILHVQLHESVYHTEGREGIYQAIQETEGINYQEARLPVELRGTQEVLQAARQGIAIVRETRPQPTAVLFDEDGQALAGITAAEQMGLSVPEDISIIGNHYNPVAEYSGVSLTTTENVSPALGERAGELVLDMVKGTTTGTINEGLVPGQIEGATLGRPAS